MPEKKSKSILSLNIFSSCPKVWILVNNFMVTNFLMNSQIVFDNTGPKIIRLLKHRILLKKYLVKEISAKQKWAGYLPLMGYL